MEQGKLTWRLSRATPAPDKTHLQGDQHSMALASHVAGRTRTQGRPNPHWAGTRRGGTPTSAITVGGTPIRKKGCGHGMPGRCPRAWFPRALGTGRRACQHRRSARQRRAAGCRQLSLRARQSAYEQVFAVSSTGRLRHRLASWLRFLSALFGRRPFEH